MIASSRKNTDKRDAFWIARALQTGMTPHPVYLPTGEVRELRALLSRRDALMGERTRWRLRARRQLQGAGFKPAMVDLHGFGEERSCEVERPRSPEIEVGRMDCENRAGAE